MSKRFGCKLGGRLDGDSVGTARARRKYLFIRILEACNANCFMCGFARSTDHYRLAVADLERMLREAVTLGVGIVRFTGGEPLLHREIVELVSTVARTGMSCSVITNGYLLPRFSRDLAASGLAQVIVSIDGATAETHNRYRDTPRLFERGTAGLRLMRELGVRTRVNTVVGAHNFTEMPALQALLANLGVNTWELSALKLDSVERYPDPAAVLRVGAKVYAGSPRPLGKPWYGSTPDEQTRYFEHGVPPRPSGRYCHVVDDVIYVDGRNGGVFPCSCLPHRNDLTPLGIPTVRLPHSESIITPEFLAMQSTFRESGPTRCTGCSATAAGYSDDVEHFGNVSEWAY